MSNLKDSFDKLMLVLVFFDCGLLLLSSLYNFSDKLIGYIVFFDLIVCIMLISEFLYNINKSQDKKIFFKKNFLDLIAAIPFDLLFMSFGILRFIQLIRLVRILKVTLLLRKDIVNSWRFIKSNYLDKILLFLIVVIIFSSLFIYLFENELSLVDSFWFVIVTITTVGYGDIVPHSPMNKIISMVLVIVGFLTLSILAGSISAAYSNRVIIKEDNASLKEEIKNLNIKIDKLNDKIEKMNQENENK
ncbi:MAG: ion channel [archaeon]|nr:ion channel [archaeon]